MAEKKDAVKTAKPAKAKKFNKAQFKADVQASMRVLYRKDLEDADQQEIFQAVCNVIESTIIDNWMESCKRFEENNTKIVYYLSM